LSIIDESQVKLEELFRQKMRKERITLLHVVINLITISIHKIPWLVFLSKALVFPKWPCIN